MRFSAIAMLVVLAAATVTEAGSRQCQNYASGCKACVCNEWVDTSKCCFGEFNGSNGNCEGIKQANTNKFQACCNNKGGFGRCW
ncbi:hypothetical protein BGZ68_000275 [Mortierella alpina]|nr:hypothetical protein BGZ68_000275 [Mortierella alpina]